MHVTKCKANFRFKNKK